MQVISHIEATNNVDPHFRWGMKIGVDGDMDVEYYKSFTFHGVRYKLYDCVYLSESATELYIGKIVEIFKRGDGRKEIKILWFFRPIEILNYLDHEPLEKEIFLASGQGVGLANTNPLEALVSKCSVICTSEDARNLQPSKDALERADFIFSRIFDVGTLTISDKLPDEIAGIQVKSLLNREEDLLRIPVSKPEAYGSDTKGKVEVLTASHPHNAKTKLQVKNVKTDHPGQTTILPKGYGSNIKGKAEVVTTLHCHNTKTLELQLMKVNTDQPGQTTISSKGKITAKEYQNEVRHHVGGDDRKRKTESSPDVEKANKSVPDSVAEKITSVKHKRHSDIRNDTSSKKMRLSDYSLKPDDLQMRKHATGADKDRRKWFKGLPWEDRMRRAHEQGRLMLLQNFDRSFTSTDIEDLIYHAFKEDCAVKVIPLLPPYNNPCNGQAYVVFKTQAAAVAAIQKINTECLMLPNGSPLMASNGMLLMPPKATRLEGHFMINKIKRTERDESRNALSSSHCAQGNTIEYEMAIEWLFLQEKTIHCFNRLFKGHDDDWKQVKNLKTS